MSNIHHLKEMILGLAVITPLACQSPPAARDAEQPSETSVTRTDPTDTPDRVAAAPSSPESEAPNNEGDAEPPAPELPGDFVFPVVVESTSLARQSSSSSASAVASLLSSSSA